MRPELNGLLCADPDCEGWGICPCRNWRKDMGFSLEHFFKEFQEILDKESVENDELLKELEEFLVFSRDYALECGQIKGV